MNNPNTIDSPLDVLAQFSQLKDVEREYFTKEIIKDYHSKRVRFEDLKSCLRSMKLIVESIEKDDLYKKERQQWDDVAGIIDSNPSII